jgi:hypothetical protein
VASSSSTEESERMCSGISSVLKISSGSRLKMKSKRDESQDYNQDQKKGMGREDYSRMVRFFGRRLLSSCGVFPLSAMALGLFSGGGRREKVDLQSTRELFY